MPETEEEFDFEKEVVATYRLAANDVDLRIKALTLLAKVQPAKAPVKSTPDHSSARKAQDKLNGGGAS